MNTLRSRLAPLWGSPRARFWSGSAAAALAMLILIRTGMWALVLLLAAYFAPSIAGHARHVTNAGSVDVVNLLLGWTLVGWVVALAMALRTSTTEGRGQS